MNKFLLVLSLFLANSAFAAEDNANSATAIFAGGCFWCMEKPFDHVDGVLKTESGYTGGTVDNPTYEQVSSGSTGHYESIKITYDAKKVSYEKLLEVYWKNIDPFDANGQFCDKGQQYQAVIFVENPEQDAAAKSSLAKIQKKFPDKKIVTQILAAKTFYPAEEYHQDYYLKNPVRYSYYRYACGRDQRLQEIADSAKSD